MLVQIDTKSIGYLMKCIGLVAVFILPIVSQYETINVLMYLLDADANGSRYLGSLQELLSGIPDQLSFRDPNNST